MSTMSGIARWAAHSPMSDPAGHAADLAAEPADVPALARIVQGVLVHLGWLDAYGLDASRLAGISRTTLPVADRLADVLRRDPRPLHEPRVPADRSPGTCRDYALLLCALLRAKGVPARLRCGFAAYFGPGWEDHWVCEYRDGATWRLADAQLDPPMRARLGAAFEPADVPRQAFLTAGEAWQACRAGRAAPETFGHGDEGTGLWFVKVNVHRDHLALNGRETSAWDGWRSAPPAARRVSDDELALLDALAADPERPLIERSPDWQA